VGGEAVDRLESFPVGIPHRLRGVDQWTSHLTPRPAPVIQARRPQLTQHGRSLALISGSRSSRPWSCSAPPRLDRCPTKPVITDVDGSYPPPCSARGSADDAPQREGQQAGQRVVATSKKQPKRPHRVTTTGSPIPAPTDAHPMRHGHRHQPGRHTAPVRRSRPLCEREVELN
jgi:hypothetical protein